MTFIAPAWLVLLVLLPVVLALHSRARRTVVVPALMLWIDIDKLILDLFDKTIKAVA